MVRQEVHDTPWLLLVGLWVGLERVHHVWELHAITDEEHLLRITESVFKGVCKAVRITESVFKGVCKAVQIEVNYVV